MNNQSVNTGNRDSARVPQGVGLLVKAFQILDLFTDERPTWTQSELAKETGLARSTLSRLVRFLHARSFLMERRGRYVLGFAAIDLGRRAQLQFRLGELCYDLLEEAAQVTGETAILTGYDEDQFSVICLAQIPSRQGGLRVFEDVGKSYPLYAGASSKAVLAYLPDRQVERVLAAPLQSVNPAVKFSARRLRAQIAEIHKNGYAVTTEETFPGVVGIGVPILTRRGHPLGSIAVAGPMHRLHSDLLARSINFLLDIGRRAAERIAGTSSPQAAADELGAAP